MRGFEKLTVVSLAAAGIAQVVPMGGQPSYPDYGIALPEGFCCYYSAPVPHDSLFSIPAGLRLHDVGPDGVAGPVSAGRSGEDESLITEDNPIITNASQNAELNFISEFAAWSDNATANRSGGKQASNSQALPSFSWVTPGVSPIDLGSGDNRTFPIINLPSGPPRQINVVENFLPTGGSSSGPADHGTQLPPPSNPPPPECPNYPNCVTVPPPDTGEGVPEPTSLAILASALLGLGASRRFTR